MECSVPTCSVSEPLVVYGDPRTSEAQLCRYHSHRYHRFASDRPIDCYMTEGVEWGKSKGWTHDAWMERFMEFCAKVYEEEKDEVSAKSH